MKKNFNPWPYGLAATLIIFCVIQLSLVTLASSGFEGLDDVEYYRHGVEYGKEITRQERQQDLGWTIAHNLDTSMHPDKAFPLRIALLDNDQKPVMHAKVSVKMGRPATIKDDQTFELKEEGPGIYGAVIPIGLGNWKFNLEADKGDDVVKVEFRHSVAGAAHSPSSAKKPTNLSSKPSANG